MTVLDDNLNERRVRQPIASWAKGRVAYLREVRPDTVIKDEAIPTVLLEHRNAVFVTTNVIDFWGKMSPHNRYSIICIPLPNNRHDEILGLLSGLFKHPGFRTTGQRMGKIIRLSRRDIRYYGINQRQVTTVSW